MASLCSIPFYSQVWFLLSLLFLSLTVYTVYTKKSKTSLFLFFFAVSLGLGFALLSTFLYTWDEQFHALVAKHLSTNPHHPQLMDFSPWLFEDKNWASHSTWLHKPPFFLYCIALSIKLMGNTVLAVRLPSVLLFALATVATFQLGTLWQNRKVGLLSALLFVLCGFSLYQLAGQQTTDHNDVFFTSLVLISFWFYYRYRDSETWQRATLVALLVALAILTKWLTGLLVFSVWGTVLLVSIIKKTSTKKEVYHFLYALLLTSLLVLPWHIYTYLEFTVEARREMAYNQAHFWEPLEGIREIWSFHFSNLFTLFNFLLLLPILYLVIHFIKKKKPNRIFIEIFLSSCLLLLFYTIAATKMIGFIGPLLPLASLLIAYSLSSLLTTTPKWLFSIVSIFCLFLVFHPQNALTDFGYNPTTDEYNRRKIYEEQHQFILNNSDTNRKKLFINANMRMHGNIQWMYLSQNKAISFIPSEAEIKRLKREGFQITCIQFNEVLPEYIMEDEAIEILIFE